MELRLSGRMLKSPSRGLPVSGIISLATVIAAGALVTPGKRLRSGYLYAGSPAREIRVLSEKEMNYFCYSANNYVKLKDRHIAELEPQ